MVFSSQAMKERKENAKGMDERESMELENHWYALILHLGSPRGRERRMKRKRRKKDVKDSSFLPVLLKWKEKGLHL